MTRQRHIQPETEYINKIFGDLTVIEELPRIIYQSQKGSSRVFLCWCVCGKTTKTRLYSLLAGQTKSCSTWCYRNRHPTPYKDRSLHHVGTEHGRLKIESLLPQVKGKGRRCICICDPHFGGCGTYKEFEIGHLTSKKIKSCGCLVKELSAQRGADLFTEMNDTKRLPYGEASFNKVYSSYKRDAKTKNRNFYLTKKEFKEITLKNCYYCEAPPSNKKQERKCNGEYTYNGIDRIDSSGGYEMNNIVPCCKTCNYSKHDMIQEDFYLWLNRVYTHSLEKITQTLKDHYSVDGGYISERIYS